MLFTDRSPQHDASPGNATIDHEIAYGYANAGQA
jgi:hypothetical protein